MKQTKFIKEFKEVRTQALEGFVNSILQLNSHGRFNNFNLRYLSVPLESTIESSYLCAFMMTSYIFDGQKEALWRNITSNHSVSGDQDG